MLAGSKLLKSALPLLIFLLIVAFLLKGLSRNPHQVSSPLLNKPMPIFSGVSLFNPQQKINSNIFLGRVSVLNVFASWCGSCRAEHPGLMDAARVNKLRFIGLAYKDRSKKVKRWLKQYGNPYEMVISDPNGKIGLILGVYGTPETFVIDRKGVVRYKHLGPISPTVWRETLLPLIFRLKQENG